ncbi:hypothetical protein VZT92_017093 [Zoarces viviparus]|uniref:Secreted protein n=1 Tax=Zoarces viviparus TaxID=48416 RepID=A0AAW1ETU5_ZOAVI
MCLMFMTALSAMTRKHEVKHHVTASPVERLVHRHVSSRVLRRTSQTGTDPATVLTEADCQKIHVEPLL